MAEFIVVGFEGQFTAAEVLKTLRQAGELEFNIEAAAVVARDDKGRVLVRTADHQMVESTVAGTIAGGIAGLLIGAVTANPIAGLLAGSAVGGVGGMAVGDLNEVGIGDDFSRHVGRLLEPGTSAICFLFWGEPWDEAPGKGSEIIKRAGGKVIRTTVPFADEDELNARLGWE